MDPIIEIRNLTYSYPDAGKPVFSRLNLKVRKGDFILLAGSSGSGKTTLLKCINGLIPNYSGGSLKGHVNVLGLNPLKNPVEELSRRVGFIFKDPENQIVCNSVANEIAFGLENLQKPRGEIKSRIKSISEELGITSLLEKKTSELSSGEKQKIVLASVLAMGPEVLLLDEPCSKLDADGVKRLNGILCKLNKENKITIILVEHNIPRSIKPSRVINIEREKSITIPVRKASFKKHVVAVNIEKLCFSYGQTKILDGISLHAREGEFISILGSNGSGKTTLMKCINGLLKPKSGVVSVYGMDARKSAVEDMARFVGFLPQNPNDYLFSETVREELEFTLRNMNVKGDVDETLKSLNLQGLSDRYPRDLSGGERQRVALASVLVYKPRVVVLDEPTRGIDSNSAFILLNVLNHVRSEGGVVIMATNDKSLARNSDRVFHIKEGRLLKYV